MGQKNEITDYSTRKLEHAVSCLFLFQHDRAGAAKKKKKKKKKKKNVYLAK